MTQTLAIDADVTAALDRWVAAIGTPDHQTASAALDALLVDLCEARKLAPPKPRAAVGDIVEGWWDGLPRRVRIKRRAWNPDTRWWEYDFTDHDAGRGYWTSVRENDGLNVIEPAESDDDEDAPAQEKPR